MVFAKQTRRRIYIRAKSFKLRPSLLTILARRLAGFCVCGGRRNQPQICGGWRNQPQIHGGWRNFALAADGGISHRTAAAGGISRVRRTAESATDPRRLAEFRVCGGRRNQPPIRGGWRKSFLRPRCPTCIKWAAVEIYEFCGKESLA